MVKTIGSVLFMAIFSVSAMAAASKPHSPLAPPASSATEKPGQVPPAPAVVTMGQELDRELPVLSKASPAAYFISYTLTTAQRTEVMGSNGALLSSDESRSRWLETQVRVGSYDLDNTHKVGNSPASQGGFGGSVPVEDDPGAVRGDGGEPHR